MKTYNIIKSTLVCGLLLPLTLSAQNLVVTTNTTVSGTHYENKATGTAASSNGRIGTNFTGGGKLNLSDCQINAVKYGIQLTNTSAATLHNVVINSGSANPAGMT